MNSEPIVKKTAEGIYTKEYCDWKISEITKKQHAILAEVKHLKENIISKKVKGEYRKAQARVKELKEEYRGLIYSKDPWNNAGIW